MQVANGIEIKKLERAYPARFDALKRFERFMIENHKQLPDEFFYQWGYVFDFEKKCVIDIVKFPNYFTKQIKKIING